MRFGVRIVAVAAFVAFAGGCSNWLLGVVQSLGSPNGPKISTIVGNGTPGYSGDNGPATSAELNQPYGIATDSSGNLYIADSRNNRVRMVDTSGNITTVASSGLNAPLGIAVDPSGDIYFSDTSNFVIRKINHKEAVTVFAGTIRCSAPLGTAAQLLLPHWIIPMALQSIREISTSLKWVSIASFGRSCSRRPATLFPL